MGIKGTKRIPPENIINEILKQKKISQTKLARLVGTKQEYISRIIRQEIVPGIALALRIAKALDVPVESLFINLEGN